MSSLEQNDVIKRKLLDTIEKDDKPLKRIASLDFLRGGALFFMVVFHSLMNVYDYSFLEDFNALMDLNIGVLIFFGVFAFFGTWHGFFLFISSIVNSYVVIKRLSKDTDVKALLLKQLYTGLVLILIGWLEQALGYYGIIGSLIKNGVYTGGFSKFIWSLYRVETLQIIGFCLIVNTIILYLFSINDGYERYNRNMIILGIFVVCSIVFTYIMRMKLPGVEWLYPDGGSIRNLSSMCRNNGSFGAWLISISFANLLPIFPFITTSFAGTMIGMTIATPENKRFAPLIGTIIGLLIMVTGVLMIAFGAPWTTIENNVEVFTYLLRLGGQIIFVWAFLYFVEFRGRGEKFANRSFVKFIRRWGTISLTLYCMKIFEFVPRLIMQFLFGEISGRNFMKYRIYGFGEELGVLFAVIMIVAMYNLVLVVWEKINFVGSFEWFIAKVQSKLFHTNMKNINDILDSDKVKWIAFIPQVELPTTSTDIPVENGRE